MTAAGDDRTFAFAARDQAGQTTFWELRLSAAGRPGGLTRLPVPPLDGGQVTGLALSADGSQLAIALQHGSLQHGSLQHGRIRERPPSGGGVPGYPHGADLVRGHRPGVDALLGRR